MKLGYKFVVLCIIVFTAKQHAAASQAGYEYIQEEDIWLRLHIVPATWLDAHLRCRLEGGVLASPTTRTLTEAMRAQMSLKMRSVFIGVNAVISKGDYMDLDGVPLANLSLPWASGEPNNVDNAEDCLEMTSAGQVADVPCTSVRPYFCRKENDKMTINRCGTTATGYKYEPRTGSCYKFHRVSRTWHRAATACLAEGGHLAVINNKTESQVLKELYENNPHRVIQNSNIAMVGIWSWTESGEWLTVFGETLSEAGFEGWSPYEPSNPSRDFCGSIKREDGLYNDFPCDVMCPFICEITPK